MKTHRYNGRFILPITEILISENLGSGGVVFEPTLEELYGSTGSVLKGEEGSVSDSGSIIVGDSNSSFYLMDTEATTDTGRALSLSENSAIDCSAHKERCVKLRCKIERIDVSLSDQSTGGFKMSVIARVRLAGRIVVFLETYVSFL